MSPRIHCVRHAQGYHNLNVANHALHDPLLTQLGEEQCRKLSHDFPYTADVDLVVASPLKRTIYTALKSFPKPLESKNLKVIVLPELQETSDLPCDTGSDVAELEREFQGQRLDLANLHTPENATWNNKKDRWAPDSDAILARAKVARLWLLARPEKDIVVVTHGGFLHYFTDDWSNSHRFEGTGWANTEFRSYNFDTSSDALLVETQESKDRRAGHNKPLSKEELKNLSRTTTNKWAEPGYQRASTIQAKAKRMFNERDLGGYGV